MLRSNIGETPKKQPFLRRGVKKDHIGFFDCGIYPLSPHGHSPYISSGTPHKATGHGRGREPKCSSKKQMHSLLSDSRLFVYLWNVRVEWHSWKYDFLLPLHFTFTIFELKLENTSARQNKIKASFVLLSSRLYVSLSLRR